MHLTIHEVIAAAGKVVIRLTNSGTQAGPFLGIRATGKKAEWLGIYAIREGKIADAWFAEDILGMMRQLGTITLPTYKSATDRTVVPAAPADVLGTGSRSAELSCMATHGRATPETHGPGAINVLCRRSSRRTRITG